MPALTRRRSQNHRQKITRGEMRASDVRGLLIYCADYRCSHSTTMSGERWPDDVRLPDLEELFVCQACGKRGADVRPDFHWKEDARRATRKPIASAWCLIRRRHFDEPIALARGHQLVTLENAGNYITKLPKAEYEAAEWQVDGSA